MATRARNTSRTTRSGTYGRSTRGESYGMGNDDDSREDTRGTNGAMRSIAKGIHVTAEMPSPKVARIIIDIDWQNLVSRVAHKVGRKIKQRANRSASSRRTSGTRRARAS